MLSPGLGRQAETCLTCFCLPPCACMGQLPISGRGGDKPTSRLAAWSTAQPAWTSQPPAYWKHKGEWATESSRAEPQSPAPLWESMVAALSHCGLLTQHHCNDTYTFFRDSESCSYPLSFCLYWRTICHNGPCPSPSNSLRSWNQLGQSSVYGSMLNICYEVFSKSSYYILKKITVTKLTWKCRIVHHTSMLGCSLALHLLPMT